MESTTASKTKLRAQQKAKRALECTSGSSTLKTQKLKLSHGTLFAAQERTLTSHPHAPTAPVWMLNADSAQNGPSELLYARVDLLFVALLSVTKEEICAQHQ